jgi:hypothetical protein
MKQKTPLHERLIDLHDKYGDDELARCALQAIDMRNELHKTRWDRARDWALLVLVSGDLLRAAWPEIAKWL